MNILVIGNGFDVAHGLPTKYDQFLDFVKCFRKIKGISNDDINEIDESYKTYISNLSPELRKEYDNLIYNNKWFEHFIATKKERQNTKQNWIDFEAEISGVIQELDAIRKDLKGNELFKHDERLIHYDIIKEIGYKRTDSKTQKPQITFSLKKIRTLKDKLIEDLKRLTRCLELYLSDYLDFDSCKQISPFASVKELDYVITFNYTDTYERLYKDTLSDKLYCDEKNKEKKIHYIHGKARFNEDIQNTIDKVLKEKLESISKEYENGKITYEAKEKKDEKIKIQTPKQIKLEECDLVLGIEEYLGKEDSQKDNEYIEFKKFYQRIYKGTGNTYTKWLQKCKKSDDELYVTIYGHSIATTDGDIIEKLIKAAKITAIYYYGKDALHDIILNLVQIIGEEELIERTSDDSEKGSIIFMPIR